MPAPFYKEIEMKVWFCWAWIALIGIGLISVIFVGILVTHTNVMGIEANYLAVDIWALLISILATLNIICCFHDFYYQLQNQKKR